MSKWTESTAIKAINGDVKVSGKVIVIKGGVTGLRACGAIDFLQNNCGYRVNMI